MQKVSARNTKNNNILIYFLLLFLHTEPHKVWFSAYAFLGRFDYDGVHIHLVPWRGSLTPPTNKNNLTVVPIL